MMQSPKILFRKLCYVFNRGFVEVRELVRSGKDDQAHDLADAFEVMPGYLPNWDEESLALIRSHSETYQNNTAQTHSITWRGWTWPTKSSWRRWRVTNSTAPPSTNFSTASARAGSKICLMRRRQQRL